MGRAATKQARRLHILDTATTVFAAKGYDKTSMEDVRAACEVSKGTLYLYFASKEALFAAVVAHFFDGFARQLEASCVEHEDRRADDQMQNLLRIMADSLRQDEQRSVLYADFFVQAWQSDAVRQVLVAAYERTITLVETLIGRGMANGEFRVVDARSSARIILGALDGLLLQKLLDADADFAAPLDQLAAMTMNTLRADSHTERRS